MSVYYGQYLQDKFLYENFFKGKTDGIFIDIGASDGVTYSNSLFFENLGWTGLCVEPREQAFEYLKGIRKCHQENIAISEKNEVVEFMELSGWGSGLSGIVNNYDPKHITRIKSEKQHPKHVGSKLIKVNCVPLQSLLDKYSIVHADFMSLDVEGSEMNVLKSIDWNKTKIDIICIENNYKDQTIGNYLISLGYKFVTRIQCDEIYKKC